MNFDSSPEQHSLHDLVEQVLSRESATGVASVSGRDTGYAESVWPALHGVGLLSLLIPDEAGAEPDAEATGASTMTIVGEGLGRHLCLTPFTWSSVFVGSLLASAGGSEIRSTVLRDLVEHHGIAVPALSRPHRFPELADELPDPVETTQLTVPFGSYARWVLTARRTSPDQIRVTVADPTRLRRGMTAQERSDLHSLALVGADDLAAAEVGSIGVGAEAWARSVALAKLSLAAFALGGQARLTTMASAYASDRTQFGRPIGSYQAVAHRCADMHARVSTDRMLVQLAAWHLDAGRVRDGLHVATLAKARTTAGFAEAALAALQVFGGHGFAAESEVQLFYRHAMGMRVAWGSPDAEYTTAALSGLASELVAG